jgi:hypothetical protein
MHEDRDTCRQQGKNHVRLPHTRHPLIRSLRHKHDSVVVPLATQW